MLYFASAQTQTAVSLDTIFGRYPYYFYNYYDNCWDHDTMHDNMICYTGVVFSVSTASQQPCNPLAIIDTMAPSYGGCNPWYPKYYNEIAVGFIPDSALRVIGFAYARIEYGEEMQEGFSQGTSQWVTDSVICSDATCNFNVYDRDMQLLQTKTVPNCDVHPARIIPIGKQLMNVWIPRPPSFLPIYEVFFDQPLVITDTFYMSKTMMYNDSIICSDVTEMCERHCISENPRTPAFDSVCKHRMPIEIRRFRNNIVNGEWGRPENENWYMATIFPIVEYPRDSCPQVRGLQFIKSGARKAFFRWNQGVNHHDWQLSYGPEGTIPEDGTILECNGRQSGLIEFDPDSHYVVYVRARCRFARDEYGPWSDPLNFCLNGNGIDEADAAGLTLSPNPTADKVTLGCSTGIRQVTVFNAAGVQVHTESIGSGTSATIDTKGWPAGQYVVTVETTAGTASRVLTVAR